MGWTRRIKWMKRHKNRQTRRKVRVQIHTEREPDIAQHRHSAKWDAW